jgi:hypothetical protein
MAIGRLCFSTYAADTKECDALESNDTTVEVSLIKKHTNDHVQSFLGFLHNNMVDSPMSIVLLGSNRNRVGSTSKGRCRSSSLIGTGAWIGASVGIMSLLSTVIAPMISLQRVLGSLGPLNTLILSSRSMEILGALSHLTLWGRESLSSCLWPWLNLWLSRTEHRSS